jgi:hypothetical protein
MDSYQARRQEARRRRRRRGQTRLAVLVAGIVVVIVLLVLVVRSCGGGADDSAKPQAAATGSVKKSASPKASAKPKPVSTEPPLVSLGDVVRFKTPEGAVIRVKASAFTDPAQVDGISPDPGQRLVTLQLTVSPEGEAGTAAVRLPFDVADTFVLIMKDDELSGAKLADDAILGASLPPGKLLTTTLAFSVGASPPVRFVCKPAADTVPVSATWKLD